jgi:hypothetical protein
LGQLGIELVHANRPVEIIKVSAAGELQTGFREWSWWDSNPRPTRCQHVALPLSYSPELIVFRKVYRGSLLVPSWRHSKMERILANDHLLRQKVAAVQLLAVNGQGIDFAPLIGGA